MGVPGSSSGRWWHILAGVSGPVVAWWDVQQGPGGPLGARLLRSGWPSAGHGTSLAGLACGASRGLGVSGGGPGAADHPLEL